MENIPARTRSCRSCGAPLERLFARPRDVAPVRGLSDRGPRPRGGDVLPARRPDLDRCLLVQLPTYLSASSIFSEYAYFSSYSDSWVEHARRLVDEAISRQGLGPKSSVVEIASNDGYLLQHVIARGIPALGVEPATNIAAAAQSKGIPTMNTFFSEEVARSIVDASGPADYVVANNVFAHIPDLNDFTAGLATLLGPGGLMSIEVAYLVRLIERNEFDTIYHEHFMYYTVLSAQSVLARHGLRLLDVEHLVTHGGSIRLWVVHDNDPRPTTDAVGAIVATELAAGLGRADGYGGFADRVATTKRELLAFLIDERRKGSTIAGYGAPGKANTLLNYCGIRGDLIEYLVDRNPYKHGRYTPGTHIPILPPDRLARHAPM